MKNISIFNKNKSKHNSSSWRKLGGVGVFILFTFTFSCSDYLNVVPDDIPTVDHAFKTRYQAEGYLYGCFSFLPDFFNAASNPALLAGDETWYIDPVAGMSPDLWYIAQGFQGTNAPLADYWASQQNVYNSSEKKPGTYYLNGGKPMFTALRDCNIFLENIHLPFDLDDEERDRWIAEVKFLKAYYHFWLFRMYGPIPLIKENLPIDAQGEEVNRYREPVDEVVNYIVSLLDEAAAGLDLTITDMMLDMGRPTKPIALAVKAQVLTLAASPLFNGNTDYASIVDNRGVSLFPQTYDPGKWKRAADAAKEAIDAAHEAGHRLYDFRTKNPAYANSLNEKTILAMQVRGAATERWNDEIIWGYSASDGSLLQRACLPLFFSGFNQGGSIKTWAPTLGVVAQFYTKNGVPVEEDKEWTGIDPMELRTATADERYYIQQNFQTIQLHFDREARFYGAITFDGGTYYGNTRITADNNMWTVETKNGKSSGIGPTDRASSTGYLCKKMIHFMTTIADASNSYSVYRYAFPVIRLADLYLMYAEALNEYGGETPNSEVYEYINLVRARTGLDGVVESWQAHAIDAGKPLRKEGMRDIIRRERLNELAFEGSRFWDLKRWKLSEVYMNQPVRGLNIYGETTADFYQETDLFLMKFEKKDYLWPIKQSVLITNKNLVQNLGW
jgi:hypothetical protein